MKIRYMSDLHLTHGRNTFKIPEQPEDFDTTLILAGDIHVGSKVLPVIEEACSRFKFVLMVFGNHEFYSGSIQGMRALMSNSILPDNFYLLDNTRVDLDGITFLGGTLWTDFNNNNTTTKALVQGMLNDYKCISVDLANSKRVTPENILSEHNMTKKFLARELANCDLTRTVVVTHYLPVAECINAKYVHSGDLNWGFACRDMVDVLKTTPPAIWVHGHTHDNVDIMYEGCNILCNPRGYGRENGYGFNPHEFFHIGEE